MKTTLLFLVVIGLLAVNIHCTSMPKCDGTCDTSRCPATGPCSCGTYKDYCNCCSFCLKCPGEECSIIASEKCAENYACKRTASRSDPNYYNAPGRCVEDTGADKEH
ncbi:8.6 kDa transglutaminase substrate-like [Uloborus diversus]|uniref:8.6 kDa transglutaminase substrate-like n=1 Tax=Uloborus diversus TaxID=327109 RepID=UPI00240A4973|nr:8.6 kDa transglutaminase substrate-like [Uloborus diversus]